MVCSKEARKQRILLLIEENEK